MTNEITPTIEACLSLRHFVAHRPLQLQNKLNQPETIFWELFHGRALDSTMTRQQATFQTWNVCVDETANEPLISVKWDQIQDVIYVTRSVLCHAHETITTATNVIQTRETTRWIRELVGQIQLSHVTQCEFETGLQLLIAQAVYGTGRLPLTSLETPLPQFLLGQLAYFPDKLPLDFRKLEFQLRSAEFDPDTTAAKVHGLMTLKHLREIVLNISLSPYTGIIGNLLNLVRSLHAHKKIRLDDHVDFLNWLMYLQWRHLNAYDLKTFHHRGANYPDALLIDEVLRELLVIAGERSEQMLSTNAKRSGIQLAWLLRTMYTGQPAPESPTSPGENLRVLPTPRVPDEQIYQPQARPRRLFNETIELNEKQERVWQAALNEFFVGNELKELGTALVLDRPLGIGKAVGEPDATPILAHVVYSSKLALRNLNWLRERMEPHQQKLLDGLENQLQSLDFDGLAVSPVGRRPRPGVVSIEDLFQTADDFRILRTTRKSIEEFAKALSLPGDINNWHTILPVNDGQGEELHVYDSNGKRALILKVDPAAGYETRHGIERPRKYTVRFE